MGQLSEQRSGMSCKRMVNLRGGGSRRRMKREYRIYLPELLLLLLMLLLDAALPGRHAVTMT